MFCQWVGRWGCIIKISCKAHLLFRQPGVGVYLPSRVDDGARLAGLMHLAHAAAFTPQNTHMHKKHTRQLQWLSGRADSLTFWLMTFLLFPALLFLFHSLSARCESKSALCYSQVKVYPVKLCTRTFKTQPLSAKVSRHVLLVDTLIHYHVCKTVKLGSSHNKRKILQYEHKTCG